MTVDSNFSVKTFLAKTLLKYRIGINIALATYDKIVISDFLIKKDSNRCF